MSTYSPTPNNMTSSIQVFSATSHFSKMLVYFLLLLALSSSFNHHTAKSAQLKKRGAQDDHVGRDVDVVKISSMSNNATTAFATSTVTDGGVTNGDTISEITTTPLNKNTTIEFATPTTTTEDNTEIGELSNTTLLIDYHQQGYNLTTRPERAEPTPQSVVGSTIKSNALKTTEEGSSSGEKTGELNDLASATTRGVHTKSISVADESLRSKPEAVRDLRDARLGDKAALDTNNVFKTLLKKKPYSKLWSVEQKWDDIFKRFVAVQDSVRDMMMKNFFRDIEYYSDITISPSCADDLRFIQDYVKKSTNFRWMTHMFDSFGKAEPGMLTGNLAELGHVVQCVKVRAPAKPSNDTFEEQYFQRQTELLGERFRGKYCLASVRPVLPEKPKLISRFSDLMNIDLLSNISYMGEPYEVLKQLSTQTSVPKSLVDSIDREHYRIDQVPFESELFQYLINQRNFMFTLPRFIGVCYPSSCSQDDIRYSLQRTLDDQHQVVDLEFDCEVEEHSAWNWFNTSRLIAYVFLFLIVLLTFSASLARYILVDKLQLKHRQKPGSTLSNFIGALDMLSLDKCVGVLFIKTKQASPITDPDKIENSRSTSIDALKGFLTLILVYSQLVHLGCLPVPFMWSKWSDAMFPFYRAFITQIFLNTSIWTESFYMISAYLIGLKLLQNNRSSAVGEEKDSAFRRLPDLASYALKRYIRLALPMVAFIVLNYVWPRLSNGYVMQDQANKLMAPCDNHGWTNLLMFHNYNSLNETCLWPSHVSASFFQLHLVSYPILMLLIVSLRYNSEGKIASHEGGSKFVQKSASILAAILMLTLAVFGVLYPAYIASSKELIVPFLIDYIDYDNYQRVIEWTVMPTYNHLTSYMIGLALAYLYARRLARIDSRRPSGTDSIGHCWNLDRENSLESINYSSTQTLNFKPAAYKGNVEMLRLEKPQCHINDGIFDQGKLSIVTKRVGKFSRFTTSTIICVTSFIMILVSLTASWFWNGLGQPMSETQTFWYMCGTKIIFNLSFACLFYKYFATKRNSTNSWMIIRFLVPIGRMSLMVFYMSWLVIWFDLLASLYQWHPSHYFIFEKFNEIIFMTLVLSLFAYGTFEGAAKAAQYVKKNDYIKRRSANGTSTSYSQGFDCLFSPLPSQQIESSSKFGNQANSTSPNSYQEQSALTGGGKPCDNKTVDRSSVTAQQLVSSNPSSTPATLIATTNPPTHSQLFNNNRSNKSYPTTSSVDSRNPVTSHGNSGRHLSIADQYKLNAELRANYSFASIGLYESAGAIDDLPSSSDPRVSPEPGSRNRY